MTEDLKRCSHCHQLKPLSEFVRHKSSPDGRFCYCRECHTNRARYYRRTRPTVPDGIDRDHFFANERCYMEKARNLLAGKRVDPACGGGA